VSIRIVSFGYGHGARRGRHGMREMPDDPIYEEARELASQLGEGLSQSTLQRRLRVGYQQARRLMDRLEDQGRIGSREHERQALLDRALDAYARALAGCAVYENAEGAVASLSLHGWSCHQDAAQVARDARETAVFYGATPAQLQAAANAERQRAAAPRPHPVTDQETPSP